MSAKYLLGALAALATAAGCYVALDRGSPEKKPAAHVATTEGASEAELEHEARSAARRSIDEQTPEVQRRYYDGWIAALERSQDLQAALLGKLERQREQADLDPAMRDALKQRIEASRTQMASRAEQISVYREKREQL